MAVYCKASVRGSGEKHAKISAGRHCQRQQAYKRNIERFMLFASVSRGFFVRWDGSGAGCGSISLNVTSIRTLPSSG